MVGTGVELLSPGTAGEGAQCTIRPMSLPRGTYTIGPDNGTVTVRTYKEGMASKIGHDLVMTVASWKGTVSVDPDNPAASNVSATFDARSFQVVSGSGGAKPLSDKDRKDILGNIADKVLQVNRHPEITFNSESVDAGDPSRIRVNGQLSIVGNSRPVTLELSVEQQDGSVRASGTIPVKQTDFGIKPFSALLGALKVRDNLDIDIEATLRPQ